jgi:hypothetical protein
MDQNNTQEPAKEFKIEITISPNNMSYKSDFDELNTISWLEFIKHTILNNLSKGTSQES